MPKQKPTFGVRMPVNLQMLQEIIHREVKHFRNYKTYRPDFGAVLVSGKFYAAHDQLKTESSEQALKVEDYHRHVANTRSMGPRNKYSSPLTMNQQYGWHQKPILTIDRNDPRFYHPKKESSFTKIEIIILMSNPKKQNNDT